MAHWYIGGLRFGDRLQEDGSPRPFLNNAHMEAVVFDNLWRTVGIEDDLWIIGDFVTAIRSGDRDWISDLFEQLPGRRRHLILGPNDGVAVQELGWDSVERRFEVSEPDSNSAVCLSYYPLLRWPHYESGSSHFYVHPINDLSTLERTCRISADLLDYTPIQFIANVMATSSLENYDR